MKKQIFVALFAMLAFVACKNKKAVETTDAGERQVSAEGKTVALNTDNSHVEWLGSKVVGGSHNGQIQFKSGEFKVAENQLVGGKFVVDMKSMTNDDLETEEDKAKLVGHLSNEDFFEVETYPTATFDILEIEASTDGSDAKMVTGTLNIKGVAKNITVPAIISVDGEKVSFASEFNIDRTDFKVNFNSATAIENLAKEQAIKDVIELKVVANS